MLPKSAYDGCLVFQERSAAVLGVNCHVRWMLGELHCYEDVKHLYVSLEIIHGSPVLLSDDLHHMMTQMQHGDAFAHFPTGLHMNEHVVLQLVYNYWVCVSGACHVTMTSLGVCLSVTAYMMRGHKRGSTDAQSVSFSNIGGVSKPYGS
jgi:hypothetical protein